MKNKNHILWHKEEEELFRMLLKEKIPISSISIALGKSEKAIRRKCERLGISSSTTYRKNTKLTAISSRKLKHTK